MDSRAVGCAFTLRLNFKCRPQFSGVHERSADVPVFRAAIKRNQTIAVLAIRLETGAKLSCPFPKNLRALRAFYPHLLIDYGHPRF
jgi:hypothetical protein